MKTESESHVTSCDERSLARYERLAREHATAL